MRKPTFCICENKGADQLQVNGAAVRRSDQLRVNRAADQCFCFHYLESTIRLLPKSEISSLQSSSVIVEPGLCGTWLETPKTDFLAMWLICCL